MLNIFSCFQVFCNSNAFIFISVYEFVVLIVILKFFSSFSDHALPIWPFYIVEFSYNCYLLGGKATDDKSYHLESHVVKNFVIIVLFRGLFISGLRKPQVTTPYNTLRISSIRKKWMHRHQPDLNTRNVDLEKSLLPPRQYIKMSMFVCTFTMARGKGRISGLSNEGLFL